MEKARYASPAVVRTTTANIRTGRKTVREMRVPNLLRLFAAHWRTARHTKGYRCEVRPDSVRVEYKDIAYECQLLRFV